MADENDISNGSLSWLARIDTSELGKDIKSIAELFNQIGGNVDLSELDNILKQQAENEVGYRKTVAEETIKLNSQTVSDAKSKADDIQKYIASIPFELKTGEERLLSQAEIDAINAKNKGIPITNKSPDYINQPTFATDTPKAFSNTDAINQAKDAYKNADAVTRQYFDDLVSLEFQLKNLQQAQTNLNASLKDGKITEEQYLTQSAEIKTALNGVTTELAGTKNAHVEYLQSLNNEGEATTKQLNILTEYRQLRNQISRDQSNGIFNQADIDRAVELEHSIRNVNSQLRLESSNTAFIDAASEGVRGLVGAFTALSGVVGLFAKDQDTANRIMQDTISFMGILQGLEQVGQAIATDGKLNQYIKLLLSKRAAIAEQTIAQAENNVVTVEGAAAQATNTTLTEADEGAKVSQAIATDTATTAQEGLNVAMLANPAAIVLLAITGLIAAYELLGGSIDKVAELQLEAEKKSGESVAKQQADIEGLLASAKNKNLSDQQRQDALNKAIQTYPEYLGYLNLDNLATQQSSDLITKQIALLKQRAFVQATQEIYADKLKKQAEAQAELDNVIQTGGTAGQKFVASLKDFDNWFSLISPKQELVNEKTKALTEATKDANVALNLFDNSAQHLSNTLSGIPDDLNHYINQFTLFTDKFSGLKLPSQSQAPTVPFDPEKHDSDKAKAVADAQNLADIAIKGTQQELSAKRNLLAVQNSFEQSDARISNDQKELDYKKYLSDISDLNRQSSQLSLQQNADYADALVLQLKNAGKEGSKEYFDAQKKALAANASEQIAQSQFDPGAIAKIKAKLTADIKKINDDEALYTINNQKDVISAQLDNVAAGSDKEFALKLQLFEKEREAAIINAQGNAAAIEKINADSEKKKNDLVIATAQIQSDKLLQLQEDNLKTILAKASDGTKEYVTDVIALNNISAKKSVTDAIAKAANDNPAISSQDIKDSSIFNEKQALDFADKIQAIDVNLAARIRAIWAETNSKNLQSDNNFINAQIENVNKLLDIKAEIAKTGNNAIINNQNSTDTQKAVAESNNNQIDVDTAKQQLQEISKQVRDSYGSEGTAISAFITGAERDFSRIAELSDKDSSISHAFDNIKNPALRKALEEILQKFISTTEQAKRLEQLKFDALLKDTSEFGQYISQAAQDISLLNAGLGDTLGVLGDLITTGASVALGVKGIADQFNLVKGTVKATGEAMHALDYASVILTVISLIVKAVSAVVKLFSQAKKTAEDSALQMQAYQEQLVIGQIQYNEELLNSKKIQDDLTQGTLDQLNAQIQLNNEKKAGYQTDLDSLTAQLAQNGQFISGEHTEKYGGILGIGRKTKVVQDFSSLGINDQMTNDQIAAILKEKEALNELTGDTKSLADEWLQVYDNISQAADQSVQLKEQLTEAFSGTTADDIAKTIVDGLAQGKVAAAQWGDDFNKIVSNALLSSITNTLESTAVNKIWATLQANINADGSVTPLSPEEIDTLRKQYSDAVDQGNALLQQAEAIFPDLASTLDQSNTLSGAIQASLTEDTANELAGLWRGQYDITKETLSVATSALAVQQQIEANTSQALVLFAQHLPMLSTYLPFLKTINDNTVPEQLKRDFGL